MASCAWAQQINLVGQTYLPLKSVARQLGLKASTAPNGKDVSLRGATDVVRMTLHQRQARINGTNVWMAWPLAEEKERFYVSRMDLQRTLQPLLQPQSFSLKRYRLRHIVIDPGHGGRDTGARNKKLGISEKTLVLDVAMRLKQLLEAQGYRVTLTRKEDRFIPLRERAKLANTLRADLFISLHFNAAGPNITGIETYVYTPQGAPSSSRAEAIDSDKTFQPANANDVPSLLLGYDIQKSLVAATGSPDRAVRRARFAVLEDLSCPGVLVEGGYVSSMTEGARLASGLYRQQIARAVADGIRAYHRRLMGM